MYRHNLLLSSLYLFKLIWIAIFFIYSIPRSEEISWLETQGREKLAFTWHSGLASKISLLGVIYRIRRGQGGDWRYNWRRTGRDVMSAASKALGGAIPTLGEYKRPLGAQDLTSRFLSGHPYWFLRFHFPPWYPWVSLTSIKLLSSTICGSRDRFLQPGSTDVSYGQAKSHRDLEPFYTNAQLSFPKCQ